MVIKSVGGALAALMVVYFGWACFKLVKRPGANWVELGILLGALMTGWTIASWPTRKPGSSFFASFGRAWIESVLGLLQAFLYLVFPDHVAAGINEFFRAIIPPGLPGSLPRG